MRIFGPCVKGNCPCFFSGGRCKEVGVRVRFLIVHVSSVEMKNDRIGLEHCQMVKRVATRKD